MIISKNVNRINCRATKDFRRKEEMNKIQKNINDCVSDKLSTNNILQTLGDNGIDQAFPNKNKQIKANTNANANTNTQK